MKYLKIYISIGLFFLSYIGYAQKPSWEVAPTEFQNSMTILCMLNIEGEISADPNDQIAMFYGDKCRAVGNVSAQEGGYYANLSVWSDASEGEILTIKIYDASADKVYELTQTLSFLKDETLGSYGSPVVYYTSLKNKKLKAFNFMSPNNDGKNDFFEVDDLLAVKDLTLKILTLKGVEVFKTKSYNNTWDGTKDGKDLPQGTYYYLFTDEKDKTVYSGSVTIVR